MGLQEDLQKFLALEEQRKTTFGQLPTPSVEPVEQDIPQAYVPQSTIAPTLYDQATGEAPEDRDWHRDFIGQAVWSLFDEASLGALGLAEEYDWFGDLDPYLEQFRDITQGETVTTVDPDTGEEIDVRVGPVTTAGKVGGALGTVGGFIYGAPAKVILKGGAKVISKGLELAGKPTLKQMLKQGAKEAEHIVGADPARAIMSKSIEGGIAKATSTAMRPGLLNNTDNFVRSVQRGIAETSEHYVKAGIVDQKTASAISNAYIKYVKDRPIHTVSDYFTSFMSNKKLAYGLGAMVQEGFQFGVLDGIREATHSFMAGDEHQFRIVEPIYGLGMGAGFGALKFLKPKGRSASFKADFINGLRAKFKSASSILQKDSYATLKSRVGILGADAEYLGLNIVENVKISGKRFSFDLTSAESETLRILDALGIKATEQAKASVLRNVFGKEANKYGKELIKWAKQEEWSSLSENFTRMFLGTSIMNARSLIELTQGVPMGADDVIINVLLGAYLNRKGTPKRVDKFPEQMQRLRGGLHTLGILSPKSTRTNPFIVLPSLDPATSSSMNPFAADRRLNKIVKSAEELGLTTDRFDSQDIPLDIATQGVSVAQSGKDLGIFRLFHRFLGGASVKKYPKVLDSISENQAIEIQNELIKEFGSYSSLKNHMRNIVDNVGGRFESEVVGTAVDMLKVLEEGVGNKNEGSIGKIPSTIVISNRLMRLAEAGELGKRMESFDGVESESATIRTLSKKLNTILNTTFELGRANKRSTDQAKIIDSEVQLEALARLVNLKEIAINNELGLTHTSTNKFDFANLWDMAFYLKNRVVNKKVAEFSKLLDKDLDTHPEVFKLLVDTGIVKTIDGLPMNASMLEGIDQIKILGTDLKPIKDSRLISEHKIFLGSVLEVLGAKGQYKTTSAPTEITLDQITRLKGFLNQKGINVEPANLVNFATETVRRITNENFKESQLNGEHIGVFQAFYSLGSPDIGNKFALMKYNNPGVGKAAGITTHKIEYLGDKQSIVDMVNEYNNYVSEMHIAGKVPGTKENYVKISEDVFTITNENSIMTIQSVLQDARIRGNTTARKELIDFMSGITGTDRARDASLTFMSAYPNKTSQLIKLLINNGAIELKPGKDNHEGTFEYYVNKERWASEEVKTRVLEYIKRNGINLETVDTMVSGARKSLETYLEETYSSGDHKTNISDQKFFEVYLPHQAQTPENIKNWFANRLFDPIDAKFRGPEALSEMTNEMKIPTGKEKQAYDHIMQVIFNKLESTTKKIFYFSDGEVKVKDTDLHSYRTPYFTMLDKLGINYAMVDGMSHSWIHHPQYDKLSYQPLDIFQSEANISTKIDKQLISQRKELFLDLLSRKTNVEGFDAGIELVEMPGLKLYLAVSKSDFSLVKDAFNKMYERQIENAPEGSQAREKLENYKDIMDRTTDWDYSVPEVFKALIAESMTVGANKNKFIEFLEMNETNLDKFFVGRQTLFNTMKFKRVNPELMKLQGETLTDIWNNADVKLFKELTSIEEFEASRHYHRRNKFGMAVFDDALPSFQLKNMFEAQNKKLGLQGEGSWAKYYASRLSESGYDSISFISKQMADFLGMHYGASGSRIFKPIISSQGEGNLMYGKTEFVYDPKLDSFFKANPELDILMAASADKLKVYNTPGEMLQIPRESMYTTGAISPNKIIDLPLDAIGIQKIPDHRQLAKLSPSVINNHTNAELASELYNDYYAIDMTKSLNRIGETLSNPFMEHELMRKIKSGMEPGELENLSAADGSSYHTGLHLEWLNVSPYASLDVFGSAAKMNPIKSRFLDTVMAPTSEYIYRNQNFRYGAKSVLMQTFDSKLQPTKFNLETGKIEQYGEVELPYDVGGEAIDFKGRNFEVVVINKVNNKVADAKEVFLKQMPGTDAIKESLWKNLTTSARPLESLFKSFEQGYLKKYDIGISVMRYPRTRPNDLTFLRLRGFVDRRSGNAAKVNPYDVYNIFEGDYDIDAIDYFWGGSKAWTRNILEQQKIFVPTVDVSGVSQVLPEIELLPKRPGIESNREWSKLDGNRRVLAGTRGLVQGTSALVKHVDNIAERTADGRKILLRDPKREKGDNGYWEVEVDWNNGDFHLRQAFEGQVLLDATSPDTNVMKKSREWRHDMLFPKIERSLSKDDFIREDGTYNTTNLRKFINEKKSRQGPYADFRSRIFRRYEIVNGIKEEVDLREIDIDAIKIIFKQYSSLLDVSPGRNVYTTGNAVSPKYEDVLQRTQKYLTHAKNFKSDIFNKLNNMQMLDEVRGGQFYKYRGGAVGRKDLDEYFKPQAWKQRDKKSGMWIPDKSKPQFSTRSPFARGVEENMLARYTGDKGGVVERLLHRIYKEDPLNSLYADTKVLTNESFLREEALSMQLLNNEFFNVSEINNFIPELLGKLNHDRDLIKRLKFQAAMLSKSRIRGKKVKLDGLNKQIATLEDKLRPLLTKEYYKSKSARDIGYIDRVDITHDRNIVDGTVQYYTLSHLNRAFYGNNNEFGYKQDLRDLRTYIGKEFSHIRGLHGLDFGNKSIYSTDIKKIVSKTLTSNEIELNAEEMLTRGVLKHGLSFLWDFAMPSAEAIENKIGIFNGNVMPVAIKPNTNYRRAVRWLLKGHSGLLDRQVYADGRQREVFTDILKHVAEIDFTWRRYFSGTSKHLPMDAAEVSKMITYGAPKWNWKLNNLFSKYTDIKSNKDVNEFNPFGMGKKYDMNIAFFRSLAGLKSAAEGLEFDKGAEVLSYTHQLMMENGYMTPQKHLALMGDVSSKLGGMMERVFPSQVDINTGKVLPLRPFDMLNNPLYVLLGGGHFNGPGMSLDPWRAMNKYERGSVNRMINQTIDMKNSNKDVWQESFFETGKRSDVLKTSKEC